MKKIQANNSVDVASVKERILKKYQNDSFFVKEYKYYQSKKISIDLMDIIEVIENKRKCLGCDDLEQCTQHIKYHHLDFNESGMIYVPCHLLNEKRKFEKKYKNLIYSTSEFNRELPLVSNLIESKSRVKIYEYINKLLTNNEVSKGLYLYGAPGIGKTFIIEVLLNIYLSKSKTCAYILLNDFFNEIKALYFSSEREDKDLLNRIIKRLKNVGVLIIDDIGSEKVDAISRDDILFPILDYRMKNEKITHFTSNYNLKELEDHYTNTSARLAEPIKAKRLLERVRVLSEDFKLDDNKSKR